MASARRIAGGRALISALALPMLVLPGAARADAVGRWGNEIARASARFGIPQDWIRRVMRIESGGETVLRGTPIVSRAGAIGLMQLMPGTWRDMRALLGLGSDPQDPSDNILAGTAYLKLMYDRFGYPGLFAAYNAGPVRYAAAVSGARALPRETRDYLAAIAPAKHTTIAAASPSPREIFALKPEVRRAADAQPSLPPSSGLFVALGDDR
jgi:soluble lytic murein transglycosylase-like protein